jgi:hypothetical protein
MWTGTYGSEWSGCGGGGGGSEDYESESPCFSCGLGEGENSPEPLDEDVVVVEYSKPTPICEIELPEFAAWPEDRGEEWGGFESGQSNSCSAFKDWEENLLSKAERKIKWRVAHPPTGTCYLKAWINTRFRPKGGAEDGTDDTVTPSTYEWTGTGNPCLTDPTKSVDDEANMIRSTPTEIGVPATNGTTTVEILKFSCLSGYTPPDDGSANGYPVPA